MSFSVTCLCGQTISVSAGEAGSEKRCVCGESVAVPRLSVLQSEAATARNRKAKPSSVDERHGIGKLIGMALLVAAIFLVAPLLSPGYMALVGFTMILLGRVWFALLIFSEMTFGNALLVFAVPFLPTLFFLKRMDVTWKPFVFGLVGFGFLLFSLARVD